MSTRPSACSRELFAHSFVGRLSRAVREGRTARESRPTENSSRDAAQGWAEASFKWKVVELWQLSAEELLAAPNVAVSLWASLAHYDGPPEVLLQRCRDRVEREGGAQRDNLLAVTQTFIKLRFPQQTFLDIFGGSRAMIESPLIKEIVENAERKILRTAIDGVRIARELCDDVEFSPEDITLSFVHPDDVRANLEYD